jgi:hypothetical protein
VPKSNSGPYTTDYRAYVLDRNGRVTKRFDFEADDDTQAMQSAKQYVDGHDVEVWQLARVVGKISHK